MKSWHIVKKDENGNKYDIRIIFRNDKLTIDDVGFIAKGKRKPLYLASSLSNDYSYRALDWDGRKEAQKQAILKVTPTHLLFEALEDVWKELQPTEVNF